MTTQAESSNDLKLLSEGLSSTQLNIVTLIDLARIQRSGSLEGCAALMDNSPKSTGKGTSALQTVCRQGQTLNWLTYCMDRHRCVDGSWPPFARISNIVFTRSDGSVCASKVCTDLKTYGSVDMVRNASTPVYDYWAGTVMPDLSPGLYTYRLIIECNNRYSAQKQYFNLDGPTLNVISMQEEAPDIV